MKIILTVLCLFWSASFAYVDSASAKMICEDLFAPSSALDPLESVSDRSEFMGTEFSYTKFPPKYYYEVAKNLPQLANSFFIHFSANGHVMVWYQGVRIDGMGMPLLGIYGDHREASAITGGIAFVIHDLPAGFDAKFRSHIDNFKSKHALTCVSSACGTLQRLGLREEVPRKIITATGFYNHLIKLSAQSEGKVEVVSFGQDLNAFPAELRKSEKHFLKNGLTFAVIGTAIPAMVGSLYFLY